jgi:hypothetical protein
LTRHSLGDKFTTRNKILQLSAPERCVMKRFIPIALRVVPMLAVAFLYRSAHPVGVAAYAKCSAGLYGGFEGGCEYVCGCDDGQSSGSAFCTPASSCGGSCTLVGSCSEN